MQKINKIFMMALVLFFALAPTVQSANVTLTDAKTNSSFPSTNVIDDFSTGGNIQETVNNLAPWRKDLTFNYRYSPSDDSGPLELDLHFTITNNSGVVWTDYHFGIVDIPNYADNTIIATISTDVDYDLANKLQAVVNKGNTIDFYAKGSWDVVSFNPPEQQFNPGFAILFSGFPVINSSNSGPPPEISYTFTVVQYPTTAPIPGSLLLLGSGILCLLGWRRLS